MALLIFAEAGTDAVVLEVGLGGRLDATNVVTPELCVISPIDFDHERYLGRSLEAIAGEKAGILKPGVPAVFSRQRAEVAPVLERRAREVGAPVAWTADLDVDEAEVDARGSRFRLRPGGAGLRGACEIQPVRAKDVSPGREPWEDRARRRAPEGGDRAFFRPFQGLARITSASQGSRPGLTSFAPYGAWTSAQAQFHGRAPTEPEACPTLHIRCPLAGEHQVENAITAAAALIGLGIPASAIERGIAAAYWPGRLELVSERPEIVLDGAHNPAGARALAAYIDRFYSGRNVRLIYGAMRDKAVAEMGGILFPHAREVIVTAPREARAMAPETLSRIAEHPNMRIAPGIEEALEMVAGAAPEDAIFITGSLFLVAEVRAILKPSRLL